MATLEWIQDNVKNIFFDKVMPIITSLGNGGILWILIGVSLVIFNKTRKFGIIILISLVLSLLVGNLGIKPLVHRIRPFDVNTSVEILISKPKDFSFPSGHTMSSFAAAVALLYMDKKIGIASLILAAIIAFSRLYLFVHYPSDVLAGMVIGIILGYCSIMIYKFGSNKLNRIEK